jgi:putative ABC transport system permease protein
MPEWKPQWKLAIRRRLVGLELDPAREAAIVEELSQDLDDCYEALLANGATEESAYRQTLAELSERESLRRELLRLERRVPAEPIIYNTHRRGKMIAEFAQDLRYGARMLLKNPGFTLVSAITLALGIGANTAIFSVINGVLLQPLTFRDPDRLCMLWADNPSLRLGFREIPPVNTDLPAWRATATTFEQIGAFTTNSADLSDSSDSSNASGSGAPERVGGVDVTANLLPTLGVQPILGRQFSAEEEQPGKDRVAIIGYALWQRRFGGTAGIIGKTILINRSPRTIVGVMPEGFSFPRAAEFPQAFNVPEKTEVWTPLAKDAAFWLKPMQRGLLLLGRLKADVSQAQAQAEMDGIAARQAQDDPQFHGGWRVFLTPLFEQAVGQTRAPLLILLGAVGCLLLIACANIAGLLLARAAGRRHELAVRAAIGAPRARIIRQLLTESLLLSLLGGGGGLLTGYGGLAVLMSFIPPNVPRLQNVSLDTRVFLFTALLSIFTGVLSGLIPAWQASKANLAAAFKDAGRSHSAGRGGHSLLVTIEVALVAVLLVGAALTLQSFRRLLSVEPGFQPDGVATFEIALPWARYWNGAQRAQFFEQTRSQLGALPGVRVVGAVSNLPLGDNESMNFFSVEGAPTVEPGKEPMAEDRVITPGYLDAIGIRLVSGRDFTANDGAGKPFVAIVNESMARQFFPNGGALGKRIKWTLDDKDWRTIVGVVRDVRSFALSAQARPQLYHPQAQFALSDAMYIALRADAWALPSLRSAIQQELKRIDPAIPVANFHTMEDLVSRSVARPRFSALLLGLFAATALLLAVVGLYGVVAYGVNQRTREFGIRLALGAPPQHVLALAVLQGIRPALIGMTLGMAGAFALTRLMANQLYDIKPTDPATFGIVAIGLSLVSIIACYVPARRAAKVDPLVALRVE